MNDRISAVASTLAATAASMDIVVVDDDVGESVQQILNYYKLQTVSGWETTPSQWVAKKAAELRNPSILLYKMFDANFATGKPQHVLFMYSQAILRACEDSTYMQDWWLEPRQFSLDDLEQPGS